MSENTQSVQTRTLVCITLHIEPLSRIGILSTIPPPLTLMLYLCVVTDDMFYCFKLKFKL
jgi:hypothetical protein